MDNLGTSEQERDDSFAWLENLAARQGASEGLLTKPEDRLEEEPDWVKRAKGIDTDQAPAPSAPPAQPAGSLEELGKSDQERDDSFAWLENLAARQGASEGLLTKPEERLEQEPDWVRQARDLGAVAEQPPMTPPAAEGPSSTDDTAAWLRSLDEEETTVTPLSENDATGMWLKSLDEEPVKIQPAQPAEQPESDVPVWMQNIEEQQAHASAPSAATEELATEEPVEGQPTQPTAQAEPELPAWMQTIEEEQTIQASTLPASADEVMAEGSDWMSSTEEAAEAQPAQPSEQPAAELPSWMQNIDDEKPYESEPVVHEMEAEQPAQFDVTSEQTQNIEEEQPTPASATATPEEMTTETPDWMLSIEESVEVQHVQPAEQPEAEIPEWIQNVEEEKASESEPAVASSNIPAGTGDIEAEQPAQLDNMPEWMQYIEDKKPAEESTAAEPASDIAPGTLEQATTADVSEWLGSIEEPVAQSQNMAEEKLTTESEEIPAWLSSLEQEEAQATTPAASDEDLPAWLRGEEGAAPEVGELEPTSAVDWQPLDEKEPELTQPVSESFAVAEEIPGLASASQEEEEIHTPELESEPLKEAVAPIDVAISAMPVDPILERARDDLGRGNIPGALHTYERLIRKTRLLDEVIYDLRDALYRFPVDVGIWQALGDAYMRANRLQDALDSYTKAEELLR
jgi:tetratricopeptide (TPR) repeat protein